MSSLLWSMVGVSSIALADGGDHGDATPQVVSSDGGGGDAAAAVQGESGVATGDASASSDAPSTSGHAQDSSGSAGPSSGDSRPEAPDVGESVVAAVYGAKQRGESGTALADAIHLARSAEAGDAPGLSVAESVYNTLLGGTTPGGSAPPAGFGDLGGYGWAAAAINALAGQSVFQGTGTGTFSPGDDVTAAELVTMMARLLVAPTSTAGGGTPASGVPTWAGPAWTWAENSAVISGVQGLTGPNATLTRAQAVVILLNALGLSTAEVADANATVGLSGTVPGWAQGALALAVQLGILQGSGGALQADQPLTRAQMAVLLARVAAFESAAAKP